MTKGQKLGAGIGILLLLLIFFSISIPNLFRSRMASKEAILIGRLRTAKGTDEKPGKLALYANFSAPERKLIYNAELAMTVGDIRHAIDRIRELVEGNNGEIDKIEVSDFSSGNPSATMLVRVPASGLHNALLEFKKVALSVEREQVGSRDVTREFYDNEAHLRNLRAEEQQYLVIIKQARSVKDTLEVSAKLSDVRDRIERLQTQMEVMSHDIDMSQVAIVLAQQTDAHILGSQWRPGNNAKIALRDLLSGLGEWLDWVVAVLIKLPLILLWVATVAAILVAAWKLGRWGWTRFFLTKPATPPS